MKLNWVSPLAPVQAEGAEYTRHVLPALAEVADVTVWTLQEEWDPQPEDHATVRRIAGEFWQDFNKAEMSFYQVGDNAETYGEIWSVSRQHPGVVILHDLTLQELFARCYVHFWGDPEGYRRIMAEVHGEEGARAAQELIDDRVGLGAQHVFPLARHAVERALGVVLQSEHDLGEFPEFLRDQIFKLPLPYSPGALQQMADTDSEVVRLIDIASVDSDRNIAPVLETMAQMPARDRLCLDVYGYPRDIATLEVMRRALGIQDLVRFHGIVSDKELDRALSRADLAIHLRPPTQGGASMAQLRIWEHALPSLVYAQGRDQEVGKLAVQPIRHDVQVEDIERALTTLVENPGAFADRGRRGRRILEEEHSPSAVAEKLLEVAGKAIQSVPSAMAQELAERAGLEICGLPNTEPHTGGLKKISEVIQDLFR